MRGLFVAGIVFVSSVFPEVATQACAYGSAQLYKGNWYCSAVKAITYTNFPGTGSYNKVTYMNASNGQCTQERYAYSGSLAPLNEEVGYFAFCCPDLAMRRAGKLAYLNV